MKLPPCYEYLTRLGWRETMETSQFVRGHCPIHDDHTPSFDIHFDDGHFYCNGCDKNGDIVKLVLLVERLPDWPAAYKRVEELDESWLPPREQVRSDWQPRETHMPATEEQRETMYVAALYWHEMLFSSEGKGAYQYYLERGVADSTLQTRWQIGYAPVVRTTQQMKRFTTWLNNALGTRWRERAIDVGLLYGNGSVRLQNRLLFSCAPPGREGEEDVGFYQARLHIPPILAPNEKPPAKFLNPAKIQKLPFTLSISNPAIDGTVVSESPFGPAVLDQHGIPGLAVLGNGTGYLTLALLRGFASPFYLSHDPDPSGEKQAEGFAAICKHGRFPSARITPEWIDERRKGLDEWVCERGPGPLQQKIRHVQRDLACA